MAFNFLKKDIKDILPGRVSTEKEDLFCYGYDASSISGMPSAVVRPVSTEEVCAVTDYAFRNNIPVIPRGAGTGMTGGSVPLDKTVIVSMEGMNRILEIDHRNMTAIVEPGVINSHLQDALEEGGLFYPPDPASMKFCTLGGNVAENAGGPRAIKYGVTRDYVLGLEVVLPDGRILTTGGKTYKGVVGYDLTRLMVGSEGTLGIVTKICLKVLPLPDEVITIMCSFSSLDDAAMAVNGIALSPVTPSVLEFMDRESVLAVEKYKPFGLPKNVEALLLIEVDGLKTSVARHADIIASICSKYRGNVNIADDVYSRQRIWEARRSISPALYYLKPSKINEDIVVPRGRIPEMLSSLRNISEKYGVMIASFGHAGDGNIHVNIMTDKKDEAEYKRAKSSVRAVFEETLRLGGTISGEHGIGVTKKEYLDMELSESNISLMKKIKQLFDPKGILNPGKIFPEPVKQEIDKSI